MSLLEHPSLVSAFLIGLLHVLEPCEDKAVASVYVAWAGKRLKESLVLILLYGLGMVLIDTFLGFLASLIGVAYLEGFQPVLKFTAALFTIVFGLFITMGSHLLEPHCYVKTFRDLKPTDKRSVLTFGFVRGLPLCPIELGILLWSASVGDVLYGTLLVFTFSMGTAISLIPFGVGASGVLMIVRKRAGEELERAVPVVVGGIMVLIGVFLLLGIL